MAVSKYVLASPVTIDVSWEQKASEHDSLDLTAFLLNKNGQVSEFSDMVFYGTTRVVEMKLTSTKHQITIETKYNKKYQIKSQCMTIDLDNLPEEIKHIVFVVSCENRKPLDKFKKAKIAFRDKTNHEDIFQIEDNGDNVFCVSVGDLQKKNDRWTLVKEETCYAGGLEKAYEDFVPIKIRKEQRPLSEFERPIISTTKGPMPHTNPKDNRVEIKPMVNNTNNPTNSRFLGHPGGKMPYQNNQSIANGANKEIGHGTMPKTIKEKIKKIENNHSNLKSTVSIKETAINTNKAANMANRFANKKNKKK